MNAPLVSILTPVYNAALYLDCCIASVMAQTYQNWELLIIDDGSTDDSLQKGMKWAERDQRIKVFHHPDNRNKGVSATRNLGISRAKGKYIALLDSDDLWLPEKLERQVLIMERDPELVLAYCEAITIDQDGVELDKSVHDYDFPLIGGVGNPGRSDNAVGQYLMCTIWLPCSSVVIRSDVLRKTNGFDETLSSQIEDTLLHTILSSKGPIYFTDEVLAKYRLHPRSYINTYPYLLSYMEYYDRLYRCLCKRYTPMVAFSFDNFVRTLFVKLSSFNSFRECENTGKTADILMRYKLSCHFYAVYKIFKTEGPLVRHKFRSSLLLLRNLARYAVTPRLRLTIDSHETNLITSKGIVQRLGVKGFGEPEGPYPKSHLPRVRWAKSPRTTIEFYITHENKFDSVVLSMSFCPHVRPSARMTVKFNKEVIREYHVTGWDNWHDDNVSLKPQKGRNIIEFCFRGGADVSAPHDSLYILFRKLSLSGMGS